MDSKKKIKFVRYNSEHLSKLSPNWRRAKGMHNKVRRGIKGHPLAPAVGYGSPKSLKSLYKSKFDYKLITSEKDLENLEKKYVLISKNLGMKKKILLLKKIKSLGINVLNIKDLDKFIQDSESFLKDKKENKKQKQLKKQESKKKVEVKKDKKELTPEEKTEKEKIEKKKVLETLK